MKTDSLPNKVFPHLSIPDRQKIRYDWCAVYSTSSYKAADLIGNIILNYISPDSTITDGTAGIGGNTAVFRKRFKNVNAVEIDDTRYDMLRHNMDICKTNNITFYHDNYLKVCRQLKQDAIFLDPPWGGARVHLDNKPRLFLSYIPIEYICKRLIDSVKIIAIKVPVTYDVQRLRERMSDYKVHHYKLRKMHLLVCSHPA